MKGTRINRQILALALPAIASNITVPLLGLSDTAISGHLGSESYLAAIATGTMMFNVVYLLCGFLRMATTGLTAEAFGRGSCESMGLVLSRSVYIAAAIGLFVIVFQEPLVSVLEWIISPQGESRQLAREYFAICVWGAPALLLTLSVNGWFVGMQNTLLTMIVSVSINVVNIALSLVLVFMFGMGFHGVAYGTLIANWAGLVLAGILLWRFAKKRGIGVKFGSDVFKGEGVKRFFHVSGDLVLRSSCILIVTLAVTSIGARMGELTLAVNTVMMQFFMFFTYFMDGFAFAGEAMCGKYKGAGENELLRQTVKDLFKWGLGMGLCFALVYLVANDGIVGIMTDVYDVRSGVHAMRWFIVLIPVVSVWTFILDGIYIGLTATRRMFLTTLVATLVFGAVCLCGCDARGNEVLWCAFLSYLFVRGAGLFLQLPRTISG